MKNKILIAGLLGVLLTGCASSSFDVEEYDYTYRIENEQKEWSYCLLTTPDNETLYFWLAPEQVSPPIPYGTSWSCRPMAPR